MSLELQLLLLLAILIFTSKIAGHISQRYLRQPAVFGEILAGLLLGPTLLNIFGWGIFAPAPGIEIGGHAPLQVQVHLLSAIGVLLLMFIAGLETDLGCIRQVGKAASWTAACGVLVPLGVGVLVARLFGLDSREAVFIGTVLTATSVSITAQVLMEMRQLRSREGMTILGAAVIDDVLGIIVLSLVVAFGAAGTMKAGGVKLAGLISQHLTAPGATGALLNVGIVILLMGVFLWLAAVLGMRLGLVFEAAERLHASYAVPATALLLIFLFALGAEYLGQVAAITGAYLVGVFLGRTRFRQQIEDSIHPFTYALFVPVFFMSIGLGVDARQLAGGSWAFVGVLIIVAILTKIVGCGLGARLAGFTARESTRVGAGMISRGEVGLIIAGVGLEAQIVRQAEYAALILMVLATTVVTPVLLRWTFPQARVVDGDDPLVPTETAIP